MNESSRLGGIVVNVSGPAAGAGCTDRSPTPVAAPVVPAAAAGVATRALAPRPAVSAPSAPAPRTPRRVTAARARSPKYSLADWFGTAWSQALPHLYWQVIGLRPVCSPTGRKGRKVMGSPPALVVSART